MINPIIMEKSNPAAWYVAPQFRKRLADFASLFVSTGNDNSVPIFDAGFGIGDPKMLAIALVIDDGPQIAGHVFGYVDTFMGVPCGMISQFHKEKSADDDSRHTNLMLRQAVKTWAMVNGVQKVYAFCNGDARARLFGMFGFEDKMRLVTMTVEDLSSTKEQNDGQCIRESGGVGDECRNS